MGIRVLDVCCTAELVAATVTEVPYHQPRNINALAEGDNATNFSTSVSPELMLFDNEVDLIVASVELAVVFVVGVFGACLLLVALFKKLKKNWTRRRKSIPNIMLFCLTLGDFCVLMAGVPSYFLVMFQVNQSIALCQFHSFFMFFFLTYAHLVITAGVPIERFIAICKPTVNFTKKTAIYLNICLLFASFVLSVPELFTAGLNLYPTKFGTHRCGVEPNLLVFFGIKAIGLAITGTLSMVILYALILKQTWKIRKKLRVMQGPNGHTFRKTKGKSPPRSQVSTDSNGYHVRQFVKDTRIINMMFVISAIYTILWIPVFLCNATVIPYRFSYVFVFLFNNSSNFIVFGIMSKSLRYEMLSVFRKSR